MPHAGAAVTLLGTALGYAAIAAGFTYFALWLGTRYGGRALLSGWLAAALGLGITAALRSRHLAGSAGPTVDPRAKIVTAGMVTMFGIGLGLVALSVHRDLRKVPRPPLGSSLIRGVAAFFVGLALVMVLFLALDARSLLQR
jgi:hypothetical protein